MQLERNSLRRSDGCAQRVSADVCVVGSGAAGISASLAASRLGLRVALLDANPALGGQAVNSIVGTFCGLYSNGLAPYQLTYGIASEILESLGAIGALQPRLGRNTVIQQYDEVALARWMETAVRDSGITLLLGAVVRRVLLDGRRLTRLDVATRYGDVELDAKGFIDASGDAMLAWLAGFDVQQSQVPIYGTTVFVLEGIEEGAMAGISRAEISDRVRRKGDGYGLIRHDGIVFTFAGTGTGLVNMTHTATPLDAIGMARAALEGRDQADRVVRFLKAEFPRAFRDAKVRSYGLPGIRQTRSIKAKAALTAVDVRSGRSFPDAIARCSWPIELHLDAAEVHWEIFKDEHLHYVPLACMLPAAADNLVAAGRCIDADPIALSSVRVMGPCIAMGAAAAHALHLAGARSVHQISNESLRERLRDNLHRCDPFTPQAYPRA